MKKKTLFIVGISALVWSSLGTVSGSDLFAAVTQQRQKLMPHVKGRVLDKNGEPIIGASVLVKGTTMGVITDVDGAFTIENVPMNSTLEIAYVGYRTHQVVVSGAVIPSVTLSEDTKLLDEVVVIGYGVQKKADLTGSVANVNAEKLNTQSNANIGQALQGKIAGVDVVSQGGAPGAGMRVMVRGIGTLNNATPLYIVDGMYMSSIDQINPSDIESIDVLKDASSAAIYGSRAANGVIIVTTKSGANTEGKPIVDISANVGVNMPSKYLDLLNAKEWADVTTTARKASGLQPLDMALNLEQKEDNDWQDIMFNPAVIQNYNLSVKGGGKYFNYYNSVGYTNHDGVMKGTNYHRYTLQSKLDYHYGIFSAGTNLIVSYDENKPLLNDIRGGMSGHILQAMPTWSRYDPTRVGGYGGEYGDVVNLYHPLAMADDKLMNREQSNVKLFTNIYLSIEPFKGFKYKLNITPDFQFYRSSTYRGLYDFGLNKNQKTTLNDRQTRSRGMLVENLFTYDRELGNHKLSVLAGYSYQDYRWRRLEGSGQQMPGDIQELIAATSGLFVVGESTRSVMTSIMARAFYSYKNRYLITATIRRDGSSKFAKDNRYGNFPSISVGWNIAEESFIKERISWLDQLKLRGGYGVLGNQEIDDYQYTSLISTGINYPDGKSGVIQGAFPKIFSSPKIKWEETAMTNVGVDFLAFRNRLSLTADWYVKNTKDILLNVPIPISSGGANDPIRNAGKIRNQGVEFNLSWNDYINRDLSYGVSFLGSFNKNEVVNMGSDSQVITGGTMHGGTFTTRTLAGYPIGGFWLIPCDGIFATESDVQAHSKNGVLIQPSAQPGDIRFKDTNNDGTINDKDRVYSGSPFPTFTYAFNGNITYKNVDFSFGLQGVAGNKIYNATRLELEDVTRGTNYLASTLDSWTPDHQNASNPRLVWVDNNRNARSESDRFLESGSYLRLRNVQVGYNLPSSLLHGIIQKARVYVNAENVFTLTKYKGYTPDANASNVYQRGFDEFIYPSNRTFMIGLNVTF